MTYEQVSEKSKSLGCQSEDVVLVQLCLFRIIGTLLEILETSARTPFGQIVKHFAFMILRAAYDVL